MLHAPRHCPFRRCNVSAPHLYLPTAIFVRSMLECLRPAYYPNCYAGGFSFVPRAPRGEIATPRGIRCFLPSMGRDRGFFFPDPSTGVLALLAAVSPLFRSLLCAAPSPGVESYAMGAARAASMIADQLPVFQMKPGYLTLWRGYRAQAAMLSPRRYFRQRRWTNYYCSLARLSGAALTLSLEFSAFAVLAQSRLIFSLAGQRAALAALRVNGVLCCSPHAQLYAGDCVQIVATPADCIAAVADSAALARAGGRANFFALRLLREYAGAAGCMSTVLRALGVFRDGRGRGILDVPRHLEVDFATRGLCILYTPRWGVGGGVGAPSQLPHHAVRLYNWKYVI